MVIWPYIITTNDNEKLIGKDSPFRVYVDLVTVLIC